MRYPPIFIQDEFLMVNTSIKKLQLFNLTIPQMAHIGQCHQGGKP